MNYFEIYKRKDGFYITKTKTFRKINNNHYSELDIINIINKNNFYYIKATGKFRIINYEELIKFNYAVYYFYINDNKYKDFNLEILNKIGITYLTKIIDIKYLQKIKIK